MSPLQWLVLPYALHSRNQGRTHPDYPCGWLKDCVREEWRGSSFPFFFFFLNNCHPFVGNLSLTTSAPLHTFILFSTRCALCHCLFHSRPPPLPFPLTHVDWVSLFYCGLFLVGCLPLSGKQLFLSAQPTLCPFTVSSSPSLTPPQLLLFISFPLSVPLSSPLIPAHSVFIRLCSLSQFGWTRLIASLALSFPLCLQP